MDAFVAKPRRIRRRHGPYSRTTSLTEIDGRCRVARQIREFTETLIEHVGGQPTPAQQVLIREAAIKNCRVVMLVDQILAGEGVDFDCASRTYLAWSNSLRRDLESLGVSRPEQQLPSPIEYLAARRKPAA
jgi:hypothetical protein